MMMLMTMALEDFFGKNFVKIDYIMEAKRKGNILKAMRAECIDKLLV